MRETYRTQPKSRQLGRTRPTHRNHAQIHPSPVAILDTLPFFWYDVICYMYTEATESPHFDQPFFFDEGNYARPETSSGELFRGVGAVEVQSWRTEVAPDTTM